MFTAISYEEQLEVNGGGWIPGDVIRAIFDCGRELGRAIANACW